MSKHHDLAFHKLGETRAWGIIAHSERAQDLVLTMAYLIEDFKIVRDYEGELDHNHIGMVFALATGLQLKVKVVYDE